jgi:uncharacterized membrane protein
MYIAITVHLLAAVVWVGGMFFAWVALRPVAATLLEPPLRLSLWSQVFARFFPWVWAAVIALLASGYWMLFRVFGGFHALPLYIHLMQVLGIVMILVFLHVFFAPYRRLTIAVAAQDWPAAGRALGRIRRLIGGNLILGLSVVAITSGGRYLP